MTLIEEIQSEFEKCLINKCHENVNDKYFEIIDDEVHKCYINTNKDIKGQFRIINNDSKEINFLAVDKCIFDNSCPPKRCDFILFDNSVFSFVEIKVPSRVSGRSILRNEAIEQLKSTIIEFLGLKLINKLGLEIEAIICLCVKKSYPTFTSSKQSRVKEFQDDYNVVLKEGNLKKY